MLLSQLTKDDTSYDTYSQYLSTESKECSLYVDKKQPAQKNPAI